MKFKELKKSLTENVGQIYLVSGDDAFFVERSVKLICNACLKEPDLNLSSFEGAELKGNTEKLISALVSYPFLSEKRVVIAREYYPNAADLEKLKGYFASPVETTVFIIANGGASANLAKQKNVIFVDCAKGDESLLSAWIGNEVKKAGIKITVEAVNAIIDFCRSDMTKINGETEKLIAYSYDKGIITEEDVNVLCVKEPDYQMYEITEFIALKNYEKAYSSVMDMIDGAGDGQKVFVSLYNHFRRLLYSSVSSGSDAEVAALLGVKEYSVKMSRRQAAKFSVKRLKYVVDKLSFYDGSFKSGDVEQQDAVWNSILNVLI
ncbi:MAG: DNA polymerase III subunit delta [Clostridia bacterium]|nr:DNA polymerase III subunit delta [Clostridia bacterium]